MNTWCVDDKFGVCRARDVSEEYARSFAQERANATGECYTAHDAAKPYEPSNEYRFLKQSDVEFKVGDKVFWGFNGDTDPGVVTRVTRSRVFVKPYRVTFLRKFELGENPAPEDMALHLDTDVGEQAFTYRAKDQRYRLIGRAKGWSLCHGTRWSRNPSF